MAYLVLLIVLAIYFLPTIVALLRKAPDTGSVIVLNFFLGWTFLGWVISMAMAARSGNNVSVNVNVNQQPGYGYAGVAYGQGQPAVASHGAPGGAQLPRSQAEHLPPQPQLRPQPQPQAGQQPVPPSRPVDPAYRGN